MNIFILHAPEDANYWQQLQKQLAELQRQNVISTYHEDSITAGSTIATEMQTYLERADMVLLLVSPDFIASDQQYLYAEQATKQGKKVVPIIVRPCMWRDTAWGKFAALPTNGKAISQYDKPDNGFFDVAQGLHKLIDPNYVGQNIDNKTTPDTNEPKTRIGRYIGGAALLISILAGLAEFSGYSLRDLWGKSVTTADKFAFTVYTKNEKGELISAINNQREIVLSLPDDELHQPIDADGKATFRLEPKYLNQKAKIGIWRKDETQQPYQNTRADSTYTIAKEGKVNIVVVLGNLDRMVGIVTDFKTNQPIANAEIMLTDIGTFDIRTTTDPQGRFVLQIPKAHQRKFQNLVCTKKGYSSEKINEIPVHTQQDIPIQLKAK